MQIREARETDTAAIVRLTAEANPYMVVTPESWLHRSRTEPASVRSLHLFAEVEGEVVARAQTGLDAHTTVTGAAYGCVIVDPAHRRRGSAPRSSSASSGISMNLRPRPGRRRSSRTTTASHLRGVTVADLGHVKVVVFSAPDERPRPTSPGAATLEPGRLPIS
jgi:hypothetical protein